MTEETPLTIGSLCTGYGGLDLAVQQLTDARLEFMAEIDKSASRLLAHHYPDTPNLGDFTKTRWEDQPHVDILTGGTPCQSMSISGLRAGMRPGTRSNLWEHMAYAASILKPEIIIWENVRGAHSAPADPPTRTESKPNEPAAPYSHMGTRERNLAQHRDAPLRGTGRVLGDLAQLGYDAQWATTTASQWGGAHHRTRVFILATRRGNSTATTHALRLRQHRPLHGEQRKLHPDRDHTPETLGRQIWGNYWPAIRTQERILGRPAPLPLEDYPSTTLGVRTSPHFLEWLMGLPQGWITNVPGLSWSAQIKMCGNGVVPFQASNTLHTLAQWATR